MFLVSKGLYHCLGLVFGDVEGLSRAAGVLSSAAGQLAGAAGQLSRTAGLLARTAGSLSRTAGQLARAVSHLASAFGQLARTAGHLAGGNICSNEGRTHCAQVPDTNSEMPDHAFLNPPHFPAAFVPKAQGEVKCHLVYKPPPNLRATFKTLVRGLKVCELLAQISC